MTMRSVSDLRDRASAACTRHLAAWACEAALVRASRLGESGTTPAITLVLQAPTEAQALADMTGVAQWLASWRKLEQRYDESSLVLEWVDRQWAAAGRQRLPQRVQVTGAPTIADLAGRSADYRQMVKRGGELAGLVGPHVPTGEITATLTRVLRKVAAYGDTEYQCLLALLTWWRAQDPQRLAGMYLREIPVPGLDTKWLERHQGVVADLLPLLRQPEDEVSASSQSPAQVNASHLPRSGVGRQVTTVVGADAGTTGAPRDLGEGAGEDGDGTSGPSVSSPREPELPSYKRSPVTRLIRQLGLRTAPTTTRIRLLDPLLAPGLPTDLAAPYDHLLRLWQDRSKPDEIIVVENQATFLALEGRRSTVAVWGNGYQAVEMWRLGWVRPGFAARLVYWGDLDVDGLSILAGVRRWRPDCVSIGMDAAALERWSALTIPDPNAAKHTGRAAPESLAPGEAAAWEQIVAQGLRLEQERLPWPWACAQLDEALRSSSGRDI